MRERVRRMLVEEGRRIFAGLDVEPHWTGAPGSAANPRYSRLPWCWRLVLVGMALLGHELQTFKPTQEAIDRMIRSDLESMW